MLEKLSHLFRNKPDRPFKLIQIEPSLECTLACVMCPWSETRPKNASMSWETFQRLVPYLNLAQSVDLTGGGEPLKQPRLVEMVVAAKAAGCEVGFSTNGTMLYADLSEQLVEEGLDWISFSVDAASPELYERIRQGARFQTVIENISALRDLKLRRRCQKPRLMMVYVMMIGEQGNLHELPAFIDLAHSMGVEQVVAKNLDVIIKDGDDQRRLFSHSGEPAQEILSALEQARLRAGELGVGLRFYALHPQELTICEHNPLQSLFVNWEGYVSPCITLSYAESRVFDGQRVLAPCQRFGNAGAEALTEIWNKPAYREFRNYYEHRLRIERQATIDRLLGETDAADLHLPPAPEGCQTCYYLYGI